MNAEIEPFRKHRLSTADYYRMAEVGILASDARVELINGEIIDKPPIGKSHASIVDQLNRLLVRAVDDDAIIRVQGPIALDEYSEPQPDVSVLRPRDDFYGKGESHPEPSDVLLLIEVAVSTLRYDRDVKIPLYAQWGVPAVWLIDPKAGQIRQYGQCIDGQYRSAELLADLSRVNIGDLDGRAVDLSGLL